MKILVVDDSKAMRMIVRRALRSAGFGQECVLEATNGVEAFHMVESEKPDLLLCDWNMPEATGLELLEKLKASGIDVDFGFVTSEATEEMRARASAAGALFLIAKPFTPEHFQEVLGKYTPR